MIEEIIRPPSPERPSDQMFDEDNLWINTTVEGQGLGEAAIWKIIGREGKKLKLKNEKWGTEIDKTIDDLHSVTKVIDDGSMPAVVGGHMQHAWRYGGKEKKSDT